MGLRDIVRAVANPISTTSASYQSPLLQPPETKSVPDPIIAFTEDMGGKLPPSYLAGGVPGSWSGRPSGQGDGNSAVFSCLAAIAFAAIEAPLRVYEEKGPGQFEALPDHPLQLLLNTPNPWMTAAELWFWSQWVKHIDGNAYFKKVRSGHPLLGNVVELWPMSPSRIKIVSERGQYITRYEYTLRPGVPPEILHPANVMHFRLGLDDQDHRRGLAPLKRLVRSLTSDAAAEAWSTALLENGAMPGLLVKSPQQLDRAEAEELKDQVRSLFSGKNRGDVGVLSGGATMEQFGFSPEQMALDALSKQPETRISGVLRVPAIVAGLGVGLDSATYSNAKTLSEWFTERTMMPLWAMDAAVVQSRLAPDFRGRVDVVVKHDLTEVRALQEDEDAKYGRVDRAYQGGWLTLNETRREVGFDALEGGDIRRVPSTIVEVPLGEDGPRLPKDAPAPVTPPATDGANDGAGEPISLDEVRGRQAAAAAAERKALIPEMPDPERLSAEDLASLEARARGLGDEAPLLTDLLEADVWAPTNGVVSH